MRFSGRRRSPRRGGAQDGFALLMVIFFLALLVLATGVAAPRILTEGKREKEQEMIWRGKQYERGIKLYYRKMGRFPTKLDDLAKPTTGNVRFMRQLYKDPMNKEDGSWRLIYVGPAGQLVGSLRPHQNLQLPAVAPVGTPAAAAAGVGAPGASLNGPFSLQSGAPVTSSGAQPSATLGEPSAGTAPGSEAVASPEPAPITPEDADAAAQTAAANARGDLTPAQLADTPELFGGNIIGVGSKINKKSVIVFDKAKNYRLFEFIWNPSKDAIAVGAAPAGQIGTPANPNGSAEPNAPPNSSNPFGPQPTPLQGNPPPGQGNNPQPNPPQPPDDTNPQPQ